MDRTVSTLGEICDKSKGEIKTGPFGSQLHQHDYIEDGIPVVMPKNIIEGRVSENGIARVGKNDVERLRRHKLFVGDIVYGRRGDIGRHAFISSRESGWLCGTGCIKISLGKNSPVEPVYLHYYLEWGQIIEWIKNHAIGATMPNLNTSILRNVPVEFPSFGSQRRIASILSAYDDLIENNTRRIQILEEMAQRIYKEWFVDFRFPGHEKVKFVDSELGKIPSGWEVVNLSDIYQTSSGGTPSRKIPEYFGGDINWVKTKELLDCHIFDTEEKITNKGLKNSSAKLFPTGTVLIAMYGANIGQLGILDAESTTNQACCAVIPSSKLFGTEYVFFTMFTRRNELIDLRAGAAQQNINQQTIRTFKILKPIETVVAVFNDMIAPLDRLMANFHRKNNNLRQTRDLLLPKLISGEIDVSEMPEPKEAAAA